MSNLLILGSGRSGTSMVAGLFRNSGVFFGNEMLTPRPANPFGYYEDREINELNAAVIQRLVRGLWTTRLFPSLVHPAHRNFLATWLAAPWHLPSVEVPATLRDRMLTKFRRQPFCFKDPRFSVTLPTWRPWLPANTRFLVVFRDPHRTTDSILRDAAESYHPPLPVTADWAYLHWWRNYRRLLGPFSHTGQWLFVHYDDVIRKAAVAAIENFAEMPVDASEVSPSVSRSRARPRPVRRRLLRRCARLYRDLCERATQDLSVWGQPRRAHRAAPTISPPKHEEALV
jgi:hypothetical protein